MNSLSIVIPDYKSPFLEEIITNAISLNPEKIIVSNFQTSYTSKIESIFKNNEKIKFLFAL